MMFVLGAMVVPGARIRWYDIVLAPLVMPFIVGQFCTIHVVKHLKKDSSKKPTEN